MRKPRAKSEALAELVSMEPANHVVGLRFEDYSCLPSSGLCTIVGYYVTQSEPLLQSHGYLLF